MVFDCNVKIHLPQKKGGEQNKEGVYMDIRRVVVSADELSRESAVKIFGGSVETVSSLAEITRPGAIDELLVESSELSMVSLASAIAFAGKWGVKKLIWGVAFPPSARGEERERESQFDCFLRMWGNGVQTGEGLFVEIRSFVRWDSNSAGFACREPIVRSGIAWVDGI